MKLTGKIAKRDDAKFQIFGWASVANDKDGKPIVDHQGDVIPVEELEMAAYEFAAHNGVGGDMHQRYGVAYLIESMVFTPEKLAALGLPENSLPSAWWVGFKVTDTDTWQKIKNGDYKMFSIGGRVVREAIADE